MGRRAEKQKLHGPEPQNIHHGIGRLLGDELLENRVDLTETRGDARNCLETEVTDSVYQGDHLRVQLQNAAQPMIAKLGRRSREFPPGTKVFAAFSAGDCRVIAP